MAPRTEMNTGGTKINWGAVINGIFKGKSVKALGLPESVVAELEAQGLSPDELARLKGIIAPTTRVGASLLTVRSASDICGRETANRRLGYVLAALARVNPRFAADGLCSAFEAAYGEAVRAGEIACSD